MSRCDVGKLRAVASVLRSKKKVAQQPTVGIEHGLGKFNSERIHRMETESIIEEVYCSRCYLATPTWRGRCIHCKAPLSANEPAIRETRKAA